MVVDEDNWLLAAAEINAQKAYKQDEMNMVDHLAQRTIAGRAPRTASRLLRSYTHPGAITRCYAAPLERSHRRAASLHGVASALRYHLQAPEDRHAWYHHAEDRLLRTLGGIGVFVMVEASSLPYNEVQARIHSC